MPMSNKNSIVNYLLFNSTNVLICTNILSI